MIKRALACLLLLTLLCPVFVCAEDTLTFQDKITVDVQAEYVDLKNVKVKSIDSLIKFLRKLPSLKKVDMFATPVYAKDIDKLVKAFPGVEFGWTMCINCNNPRHKDRSVHKIRTDDTAFSTLHNNQCTRHTSKDFEILKYCKNMMALDIGHNAVTDLSFLEHMPKLRVLIIGRNGVTDLSPLKACPELEYLEAFTNNIESVEPLLSCPHLIDLNIPNNSVKDPELFAQMTSLKRLWAFNCSYPNELSKDKMPAKLKTALKKALPKCRINWTSGGTIEWRDSRPSHDHPHHKVIMEMFEKKHAYVPFADSYK